MIRMFFTVALAVPFASAQDAVEVAALLPGSGILPYACVEPPSFAGSLRRSLRCLGAASVRADDALVTRWHELFTGERLEWTRPVGQVLTSGKEATLRLVVTDAEVALKPGAYHVVVDLVRGGKSVCAGRVGSTTLYAKTPGESPQHVLASMGLAETIFTRNRRSGGYFHANNSRLPPTLDPFDDSTYNEFIKRFGASLVVGPETHPDGGLGYLYMAQAYRVMGEESRAAYAEDALKWLLDGCFDFYTARCGGAGNEMQPGPSALAFDADGPIDGEPGPGPRSRWGCSAAGELPVWTVDLARTVTLDSATVSFGEEQFVVADFDLEVSSAEGTWKPLCQVRGNMSVSVVLDLRKAPETQRAARLIRIRFVSPPRDGQRFVLDEVRLEGTPADGGPTTNWATLEQDAVASATRTEGPAAKGDWLDTDQSAGILQLAARSALYFREHQPDYAASLFRRCGRVADWVWRRSWTPDTEVGLHLHRYRVEAGTRERHVDGWWGYDGRVLEGVAWCCAAYPAFHDGEPAPADFSRAVDACRNRILQLIGERDGDYFPMPGNHCQHLAQQYLASALVACAAAEQAAGLTDRAKETLAGAERMIHRMCYGFPRGEDGRPHRPVYNSGDTGPHFFYTIVEYLARAGEDPVAEDYVSRLPDFVWLRALPDQGMLREAGHRAAVPSTALWVCPEHRAALAPPKEAAR